MPILYVSQLFTATLTLAQAASQRLAVTEWMLCCLAPQTTQKSREQRGVVLVTATVTDASPGGQAAAVCNCYWIHSFYPTGFTAFGLYQHISYQKRLATLRNYTCASCKRCTVKLRKMLATRSLGPLPAHTQILTAMLS